MPFKALLIDTLDIYHEVQGSVDAYNNPTKTWTLAATERGRIQQLQAHEQLAMRDTLVATHRCFLAYPSAIDAYSEVTWGSRRFRVKGTPWLVEGAKAAHHYEVFLEEVVG